MTSGAVPSVRRDWVRDLGNLPVLERLCRFVPAPVVEAILGNRMEEILAPRQQEVIVLFADLRGFTRFVESSAPDEVAHVLSSYHRLMGSTVSAHGGTLERFTGDGTMVFFGDEPLRPDALARAVRVALDLRAGFATHARQWRAQHGRALGLGIGMSQGHATTGIIGFDGRWDYGVIGPVTNLAARLCQLARSGEILLCPRMAAALDVHYGCESLGAMRVKGLPRKVEVFRL